MTHVLGCINRDPARRIRGCLISYRLRRRRRGFQCAARPRDSTPQSTSAARQRRRSKTEPDARPQSDPRPPPNQSETTVETYRSGNRRESSAGDRCRAPKPPSSPYANPAAQPPPFSPGPAIPLSTPAAEAARHVPHAPRARRADRR